MGKTDELIRNAGAAMALATSIRPAPVAMPSLGASGKTVDNRRDGLDRSKDFWFVPIDRIDCDRSQPREAGFETEVDPDTGEEKPSAEFMRLVNSLDRDGLLQPISVVYSEETGRYRVLIGERRFRAASTLKWQKIAAKIVELDPTANPGDPLAKQVIENVIRENLKPLEQAKAYRTLLDVHKWTMTELGTAVGCSAALISQSLKLLDQPASIRAKIESGELSANSAYHVSKIDDPAEREKVAERIVSEGLNRNEAVEAVKESMARSPKVAKKQSRGVAKPKAKPLPRERTIKTSTGIKVIAQGRKGFTVEAWVEALREALESATAKVEPTADQAAA